MSEADSAHNTNVVRLPTSAAVSPPRVRCNSLVRRVAISRGEVIDLSPHIWAKSEDSTPTVDPPLGLAPGNIWIQVSEQGWQDFIAAMKAMRGF